MLSLLIATIATEPAQADRFAIETFEPSPFVEDSVLQVAGTRVLTPGAFTLSVFGAYGRKPLSLENQQRGNTLAELVGSVGTLQLMGAVGLFERVDIGLALPLHRVSRGSEFDPVPPALAPVLMESTKVALGDLRIVPRVRLLGEEHGFGLALLAPLHIPTGKDEHYAGEPLRVEPRVAVDYRSAGGALVALNAGYMVRSRAQILGEAVDDMVRVGLGAELPIAAGLSGLAEVDTQLNVLHGGLSKADAPTEGLLGLRYRKAGFVAQLGGGPGIVRGIGTPRYRLFAGLSFTHTPPPDSDGDGLTDDIDRCPNEAEDRDGFEDEDGCPDLDNDADGIPDASDRCPNEAEDRDGFEDEDGCPDLDNDADGIPDASDRCVHEPEDTDGFEDEDGCPEVDNDNDGILDGQDRCPNEAGVAEEAGCPAPPPPPRAKVTEEAIELAQQVQFQKNSAAIETSSDSLLDEVAALIVAHPELEQIVVEGHTDTTGSARRNRELSRQRAEAVREALIARGVEPGRLEAKGFGPDQPIADNDTQEGRVLNRRVNLRIEKRAPADDTAVPAGQAAP